MSQPREDVYRQNAVYHKMPQQNESRHKKKRQSQQYSHRKANKYKNHSSYQQQQNVPSNQYPQYPQYSQYSHPPPSRHSNHSHHSQSHQSYSKNNKNHSRRQYQNNQKNQKNTKNHQYSNNNNNNNNNNHQYGGPSQLQLQSHHNESYYHQQPSLQYSQQRHEAQLQAQLHAQLQYKQQQQQKHQQYYKQMQQQYYQQKHQHQQQQQKQQQKQQQQQQKPKAKEKHKKKEKPLLNESCSLPEDDEVLRASVLLLESDPNVGDGYSSDNTLFYGKISVTKSKNQNNKTAYLHKLGKEILTNNPKFRNIDQKDELAMRSSSELVKSKESKNLYNALTKRLNEEENQYKILSDDSFEKVRKLEKDRKAVIHARQKMRRHKKQEKSYIFFKYGSIGTVLCNLSASTLGCSVLCIPYVFSLAGWLYGFIIITVIVLLQLLSMRLLLQCQKCTGVRSIQQLTILYLKNKCGVLFINVIIFGYCFTQCIAILIALADLIQPVFHDYLAHSFLANRSFLLVVVTLFILLPLSFRDKPPHLKRYIAPHSSSRKKAKKKHPSQNVNRFRDLLYNICMIYFLFAITIACIVRFCDDDSNEDISFDSVGIHTGIYIDKSATMISKFYSLTFGFPIILYCLTTHTELFKVNEKLSSENRSKLYSIAHGTLIQHTIYILILGTCGYFYFSKNPKIETNIILNLKDKSDDIFILIAMIIIGIAMFLFYPSVLEPSRHSMSILLFPNTTINITQHILLTFCVDIFALIIALFIRDLAVLFAWSGAIFATILCLILPGLLFWNIIVFPSKTFVHAMMEHQNNKKNKNKSSNQSSNLSGVDLSKYNLNAQSTLNSIIATATPPLINYARTVNDEGQIDEKSSMLSGSSGFGKNKMLGITAVSTNAIDGLPNIMTPDAFNQVITESYSRLYGTHSMKKKSVLMAIDGDDDEDDDDDDDDDSSFDEEIEKKYNNDDSSQSSTPDSMTPSGDIQEIGSSTTQNKLGGIDFNSEYVSLSSHTKQTQASHTNIDSYIDIEEEEEVPIGSYEIGGSYKQKTRKNDKKDDKKENDIDTKKDNKSSSKWWQAQPRKYHPLNKYKRNDVNNNRSKHEQSTSRTAYSQSKTHNLREASKTIQEKIESQLNEEKMQRIKTLEKVNQSWTFWFDRVGALLLLICGVIMFIVTNSCNILHIFDVLINNK